MRSAREKGHRVEPGTFVAAVDYCRPGWVASAGVHGIRGQRLEDRSVDMRRGDSKAGGEPIGTAERDLRQDIDVLSCSSEWELAPTTYRLGTH